MSNDVPEQVLVIRRSLLDEIGSFQGVLTGEPVVAATERMLAADAHFFMDRAAAELDPTYKQLISYCIFRHGSRILQYTRGKSGGETRLHAKISVGVGGHINPGDMDGGRTGPEVYRAAVLREIAEELAFEGAVDDKIVAILNDDSNLVGQVHLGVVHLIELESDEVRAREDALHGLGFRELSELSGPLFGQLETWSQHCVRYLEAAEENRKPPVSGDAPP